MNHPLLITIPIAIGIGALNAFYWKRQGYPFWTSWWFGAIVSYALILMVLKAMR